jgi:ABC-type antimicrobial peptide transport system permease subunit
LIAANIRPMSEVIAQGVSTPRFNMVLVSAFASIALLLASIGIYGVIAYSVAQRHQEIGVRMALGATRRDILRLVVSDGILIGIIGAGLGLAGALALSRVLNGVVVGISVHDPLTFAAGTAVLLIVAIAASYSPARRAAQTDPTHALRA